MFSCVWTAFWTENARQGERFFLRMSEECLVCGLVQPVVYDRKIPTVPKHGGSRLSERMVGLLGYVGCRHDSKMIQICSLIA